MVRALLARGHRVRGLARDPMKLRETMGDIRGDGFQAIFGSVFDAGAVGELCSGCGGVIHTIGIRREAPPAATFERMHPVATGAVLRAAAGLDAKRFIHVSALGVGPEGSTEYYRSKYESEQLVRASGLDWTILRPGLIHGPDGELIQMIKGWVLGRNAPHFFLPYFARVEGSPPSPPKLVSARVAPVSVLDVAEAAMSALERPESIGEVYPLTGPETLTWPELLTTVRDAMPLTDKRKKPRPIPGKLGWLMAKAAKPLGLSEALPFGPSEPIMAMDDSVANCGKAAEELGFIPRGFRATVRQYAGAI